MLEEMNSFYNPWSVLQQTYHPSRGMSAAFRSLLAALDMGWQVEQAVQVLPAARFEPAIYRFILKNPITRQDCQIDVPVIPEVERMVEINQFSLVNCCVL